MRKTFLSLVVLLLLVATASAGLLTGQTPSSYTVPPGWSLVRTQDFESGCGADEECAPGIGTSMAHGGTHAVQGEYAYDQASTYWALPYGIINPYSEVYISFYEYIDSQARFNDEFVLLLFQEPRVNDQLTQEIILDYYWAADDNNNPAFNTPNSALIAVPQGNGAPAQEYLFWFQPSNNPVPTGAWHQWEIHYRPNSTTGTTWNDLLGRDVPGSPDGFMRIYLDGEPYGWQQNGVNLNGGYTMQNTSINVGGLYTKLVWMNEYPACNSCSPAPGTTDLCREIIPGMIGQSFADPYCNPTDPPLSSFHRYLDDVIVLKMEGETLPPPESAPAFLVQYTRPTDWTADTEYSVNITAEDTYANALNETYTFTTESGTPTALNITTAALDNGTVGTAYSEAIVAEGGTSPYTFSLQYQGGEQDPNAPYPYSTTIVGVDFDFANKTEYAEGSDIWSSTWAGDGNTYTAWGDGGGFSPGTNTVCGTRFGLGQLTGTDPTAMSLTPIWGCKADDTGCRDGATHDAGCDAPYGGTEAQNGVPDGLFAIDNTLYATKWIFSSPPVIQFVSSTDLGHTWTPFLWSMSTSTGDFTWGSPVQFGAGYTGARDSYVYFLGSKVGDINNVYLARAPKTSISTRSTWQYFIGTSSSPSWGSMAGATPIFTDNRGGFMGKMQYFPVIGKYVFIQSHGATASNEPYMKMFGIFEAAEPWGPWKTVYYTDAWPSAGDYIYLNAQVINKTINAYDNQFLMALSSSIEDSLWVLKTTFHLASEVQSLPDGLSLGPDGIISGTPTTAQTKTFTVVVTDAVDDTDTQELSITVNPSGGYPVTEIRTIQDTYMISGTTQNFSTADQMYLYTWPANTISNNILMKIDLSEVAGTVPTTATLRLYMIDYDGAGGQATYNATVHRITGVNPTVSSASGAYYNGSTSWTGGAVAGLQDIGAAEATIAIDKTARYYNVDVTAMVRDWLLTPSSNKGLIINPPVQATVDTNRHFATINNSNVDYRPVLFLTYVPIPSPVQSLSVGMLTGGVVE